MATRKISTQVELSGEQQYKKALSELGTGLNTLNSEMRKTSAQFADNANSMEAMRAKGDVLDKQLQKQREKVEVLRQALANASAQYGESDKRTQQWAQKLNDAEAAVYKTEAAIRKNNEAMEKGGQSSRVIGAMVDQLTDKFGSQLPKGMQTALQSIGGFSDGAILAFGAVVVAVKALVDIEKKLIDMTTEAAASADEILTESVKTGLSTERIQEMRYSAELLDVSYETIAGSLTKLKRNMDSAASGTGEMAEKFAELGVSVTDADGGLRNAEDVFYECIDALGEIGNATERDAAAMGIFGKSAEDLNPLITAGTDAMKAYAEEAQNVGYVLSGEELNALGDVDNAYQRLQNSQEAIRNHLAAQFAPALAETYTNWTEFIRKVGNALAESKIVESLGSILQFTSELLAPLAELTEYMGTHFGTTLKAVAEALGLVADTISLIVGLVTLNGDKIKTALGLNLSSGQMSHYQQAKYGSGGSGWSYDSGLGTYVANGYNAPGDMNYRGGATWVGENGPELVTLPRGSSIASAQESRRTGGNTFNITIDAKSIAEFNDVIRIAQEAPMVARMGA